MVFSDNGVHRTALAKMGLLIIGKIANCLTSAENFAAQFALAHQRPNPEYLVPHMIWCTKHFSHCSKAIKCYWLA